MFNVIELRVVSSNPAMGVNFDYNLQPSQQFSM